VTTRPTYAKTPSESLQYSDQEIRTKRIETDGNNYGFRKLDFKNRSTGGVNGELYTASVVAEWMNVECWWNESDRETPKNTEKNM
jgi:hypothetical protein